MSWQAMGAVQEASGFVGNREFIGFRVLMAIAWYADESGVAGRKGQRKACPTQRAIAARARVHVNTVASWLPRLVQAGELALERYGSGRGTHTVYRILLPVERSGDGQRVVASGVERSPDEGEKAGEVMRRLEALEQRMGELVRELEDSGQGTAKVRSAERPHESPHGGSERPHENRERPRERPHGGSERAQERPHGGGERSHEGGERPHENRERPQEGGKKATGVQRGDVEDPLDPFFDPVIDPEGDPGGSRATGKHKDGKGHTVVTPKSWTQKRLT